jgi:hypothetical protein
MEIVKFYFSHNSNPLRLLITFFYLVTVSIIVTNILGLMGYQYQLPKDITLAVIIEFILSGQVLFPILIFSSYVILAALIGSIAIVLSYRFASPWIFQRHSCTQESIKIRTAMINNGWARYAGDKLQKGNNFKGLLDYMDNNFNGALNMVALMKRLTTISLNSLVILLFFTGHTKVIDILLFVNLLWCLIMILGLWAAILTTEYKPYYQMFINHLEEPETYPHPPPHFSPESNERRMKKRKQKSGTT